MSLETLLEAAEFLERNNNFKTTDGNQQSIDVNSVGGHLKIDPNLPISFQFHTYSSVPNSTNSTSLVERNKLRINSHSRTKSASFSVSNSAFQQSRATIRRNRNLTSSDKTSVSEATTRHRELHKTLEKNRRVHLRSCFNELMNELPKSEYAEKKYSHINIIHFAIRYIHQLKQTESDQIEELDKLNRIRGEYQSSLHNLKQQLIDELNNQHKPNSTNQSSDSSLEDLNDSYSDQKRIFSIRSQKEIDELLLQVEQSLLCATSSEAGSEVPYSQLDNNSDDYDDETTCSASEGDDQDVNQDADYYGNTMLSQCHA